MRYGWLVLLFLVGCAGSNEGPDTGLDSDTDPEVVDTATVVVDACDGDSAGGLLSFQPSSVTTPTFGELAPDFTLVTTTGEWSFSENYNGCDLYLFTMHYPGWSYSEDLWEGSIKRLLEETDANVHYFFISYETDDSARLETIEAMEQTADNRLKKMDEEVQESWEGRLHFVTPNGWELGWISSLGSSNIRRVVNFSAGFNIDRTQLIRPQGEMWDWGESKAHLPWLSLEGSYLNWSFERDGALAEEEVTVVPVYEAVEANAGWSGPSVYAEVELPADIADYDSLDFDLELSCYNREDAVVDGNGDPVLDSNGDPVTVTNRDCPEWDREANLYLCEVEDTESCSGEVGRYITAYSRGGRWVHDATPALAMLKEGGGTTRRFRFHTIDRYELTFKMRFKKSAEEEARPIPTQIIPLWGGRGLDADYNSYFEEQSIEIPETAKKVEIAAIISGHGWGADTKNCAEFCDHRHHFSVNEQVWTKEHPEAGEDYGCVDQFGSGLVPNQYGSWPFGRGGWCPGMEVPYWVQDVTAALTPGAAAQFGYSADVDGSPYEPVYTSDASYYPVIKMSSWLVIYE
jgi:hypothetical protein